ncbi:MAG: M14 family zinc carboxypeptidase [Gemmatimonadota bacterium]|nr:M14 family zinc carboxypeptidase [Gemmatimonadota bacterium]
MAIQRRVMAVATGLLLTVGTGLGAQTVPTFREVTGRTFGERITQHFEMERYLLQLAQTPRVRVVRQGESWEGRPLWIAIVTSPENHARLQAIRDGSLRLRDPRGLDPAAAERLLADQPAVVWFGGSIHGFELSGAEGALKLLEHLTTRNDPATLEALRNTVVLIDPMLNPDGRDAFAHLNHESIGRIPSGDRDDWSNDFSGWQSLKFRTGHYYFDTNRDWFAHTQNESRYRVAFLRQWAPQVAVDMHEMGPDAEFYFDPPGDPTNPHFPAFASRWFTQFGAAYAASFDSAGFEYMTRERYNYFYPGYTSNRGYQGAVAMLFEQGSTRGLTLERGDGSVRTLADALEQQYVAAWTAVRVAATRRDALLRDYLASQQAVVNGTDPGRGSVRRYVLDPTGGDPLLVRELVHLLARNDIAVGVTGEPVRLSGLQDRTGRATGDRAFPAGSYVIETAQPAGRLVRTLLAPETPLPADFLRAARARVERAENPRFYDITAWSLPLLFNVDMFGSTDARTIALAPAAHPDTSAAAGAGGTAPAAGAYALLLDGANAATTAALWHLRQQGHRVGVLTAPTQLRGAAVPGGTGIVRLGQNDSTVARAVAELADRYGIGVITAATGLADSGFPSLGSGDHTFNLQPVRVGLLAEDGIQGYSFGWTWYTLDRQYEIPVTVIRTRSVRRMELERYDVLVIPEANATALAEALGDSGAGRLERWVRDGGTLVTVGAASQFARERFKLALRDWYETDPGKKAQRFDVPGAIFAVELEMQHWASAGYRAATVPAIVTSPTLYLAPDGPPNARQRVIARYAAAPRLAGHAWAETLERAPGAVFAYEERVGAGRVIAFAEEMSFRAFARSTNRLFLNAVVLGPSAP